MLLSCSLQLHQCLDIIRNSSNLSAGPKPFLLLLSFPLPVSRLTPFFTRLALTRVICAVAVRSSAVAASCCEFNSVLLGTHQAPTKRERSKLFPNFLSAETNF